MKFISEKCSWIEWIIFVTRFGNQTKEKVDYEEKIIRGYDGVYVAACTGSLREYREQCGGIYDSGAEYNGNAGIETESEAEIEESTPPEALRISTAMR